MQIGDHLVSPRPGYIHHGLYIGGQQVIHYASMPTDSGGQVVLSSLDTFCKGRACQVVAHARRAFTPEQSVMRALSRLGESQYHLLLNNCEHFVTWCIQGFHYSEQIEALIHSASGTAPANDWSEAAIPVETMSVDRPGQDSSLGDTVEELLRTHVQPSVALLASRLALRHPMQLVSSAVVGAITLYGAKKLIDWLQD